MKVFTGGNSVFTSFLYYINLMVTMESNTRKQISYVYDRLAAVPKKKKKEFATIVNQIDQTHKGLNQS